ncbi:MAG: hypothetical protein ACOH5I_15260 [Oligoflexus sp.]
MKFRTHLITGLLCSISWEMICSSAFAQNTYKDPEFEIKRILHELDEEKVRIQSMTQIRRQPSVEINETISQQYYRDAEENFKNQAWVAVVRNLNSYLNSSQRTETDPYLAAQYMLGYAYQQLGYDERAARAYLRYLASFITEKNYNEGRFQSVLHRLLMIHMNLSDKQQQELRELLSAIANLELPRQLKAEVLFLSALTASHKQIHKLSEEWFQDVQNLTDDPRLQAQSLFYSGMLAVKLGKLDDANEKLEKLVQTSATSTEDYQHLARINLARIAVLQNKPQTALGLYQLIPNNLPLFREALNEQIHIHLDREEYTEAKAKTKMLMKRYPDSLEAQRLRIRLALLSLQSGDVQQARTNISSSQQELNTLKAWLRQNLPEDEPIRHQLLLQLAEKTEPYTELPPVLSRGLKLYNRMAQVESRLGDIRAEIRSLVLALGRLRTDQYQPEWTSRAKQLESAVRRIMAIGDRISNLETHFYENYLTGPMKVELQRSRERREKMTAEQNPIVTQRGRPHSWARLAKNNERLAELYFRAQKAQSEFAALRHLNHKTDHEWTSTHARILDLHHNRLHRINQTIQRAVEITRARRIRDLANQGQQLATQRLLINHAIILYEESALLEPVRDQFEFPNQRHMAQEANLAWKKWEFLVKQLHNETYQLDEDIRSTLTADLQLMEQMIQSHDKLQDTLLQLSENLAQTLGKTMPANLAHLDQWIDGNQARLWKWEADLSWLDYMDQSRARKRQQSNFEMRSKNVKEDLRDLEQRNRQ